MADKEMRFNVVVGAVTDEASAKKASRDITEQVLGALKNGYIEIPTTISDKFDKSKASVKLLRAQEDFVNQWKKMSAEGFSSSERDLQTFIDKFTEFKRLMGKEGKSNSKQNLAIRDTGLGEIVQAYRNASKDLDAKIKAYKNLTTSINSSTKQTTTKKSTAKDRYLDKQEQYSNRAQGAGEKAELKRELDYVRENKSLVQSSGNIRESGFNEYEALLSKYSQYASKWARDLAATLKEETAKAMAHIHRYFDKDYVVGSDNEISNKSSRKTYY